MKDIQGIQRGKCNYEDCECGEYMTVEDGKGILCEYCGHRPVDHVRMVALGPCRSKGCGGCDKYEPESPNSYSDCSYCGCSASAHQGAEMLRKSPQRPPQQYSAQPPATASVMSVAGGGHPQGGGGGQHAPQSVKMSASGVPLQTLSQGKCDCPGCPYGKSMEGGQVHPYCSRTCAHKHKQMQGSFHAQKLAQANQAVAMMGGSHGGPMTAGPQGMSGAQPPTVKMCKVCKVQPANPGRSWCESCYKKQQQQPKV